MAEQVNNGAIVDIKDIRDESNRDGIRVVIELKKGANTHIILQRIYSLTDFQANYSIHFVALVNNRPQVLSLKKALEIHIQHRTGVIERRTQFELDEAEAKAHVLRGLLIALHNIDEVIAVIKKSANSPIAKEALIKTFSLDAIQAQAILDMRLHRLTSLEIKKIEEELAALETLIKKLQAILADPKKILAIVKETIEHIANKYGDERKTEIQESEVLSVSEEEFIDQEDVVITLTQSGYIKRTLISEFGVQRRGGKGKFGISLTKNDVLAKIFVGNTHDPVLFITSNGRSFILKLYQIPEGSRTARGQSISNLLNLEAGEYISSLLPAPSFNENESTFLFLATSQGKVKKISWKNLTGAVTKRGIRAITLKENDFVVSGVVATDKESIFLFSSKGRVLRFFSQTLRTMGRTGFGVSGMKTKAEDSIVGMQVENPDVIFMLLSSNGYGKRLKASDINPHGRNTSGVVCMGISEKTGNLLISLPVQENDAITAMTQKGKTLRVAAGSCAIQGRAAQGVSVITVDDEDQLSSAMTSNNEIEDE